MYSQAPELINPYYSKVRELSNILFSLDDVRSRFVENSTQVLDLGCGYGHFLDEYLSDKPDWIGLGVEKRYKRTYKSAKKLENRNSFSFNGDVREFVTKCPSELWNEVWMQFPDPWPRKKHEKHRMIRSEVFFHIYRILKDGGRFCFVSDCKEYWDYLNEENQRNRLYAVHCSQEGDLFSQLPKSSFKKIFLSKSIPIYSIEFRKFSTRQRRF